MKIALVSALMKDNDIKHQMNQIEKYVSESKQSDLICFGESFLQGFEGLTWEYKEDIKRALSMDSNEIEYIKSLSKKYKKAISFGFIENYQDDIYSSNMVIDENGNIIDIFRRVSIGWKEPIATKQYKEGKGFNRFKYKDKDIIVAICGDLWHDEFLEQLKIMKADALLWPLYVDFSIDSWNELFEKEYIERTKDLPYKSLMINSFVEDDNRANGGCYVFSNNTIVESLSMGEIGVLEVEI